MPSIINVAYLSRVFSDAVASIDHGNRGEFGGQLRTADIRVTDDNSVSVASERSDGVRESLPFEHGRVVHIDSDNLTTTTLHRSIE